MPLVEQHRLDRLDRLDPRWQRIDAAAFASKNRDTAALYNAALSVTRHAFIPEGRVVSRVVSDEEMARDVKTSAASRALPAKVAQWVLKPVALAWTSYFAACAAWQADPSRFLGHPQLPNYRDKRGRNLLTDTEQAIRRSGVRPSIAALVSPQGCPSAWRLGRPPLTKCGSYRTRLSTPWR
jgi:putative transposase